MRRRFRVREAVPVGSNADIIDALFP